MYQLYQWKHPTKLNTRHQYQLDVTDNLPPGIKTIGSGSQNRSQVSKIIKDTPTQHRKQHSTNSQKWKSIICKLQPIDAIAYEVNNISWTNDDTTTMNKPAELPCMTPESSFQPDHNINKHSIVLEDAQILQEAKDGLSSLLQGNTTASSSKSHIDVGRTNISNSIKVSEVCWWRNKAVRKCRLYIKKFKSGGHSSYHST